MKRALAILALAASLGAQNMRVVTLPSQSPLVTFRVVFLTGSASDPAGKAGVASLTAAMLASGGTKQKPYQQIVEELFPMAASIDWQVDKEMTTFSATTHVENLEPFYALLRSMLLEPGWRNEDFSRLRDDQINGLRVGLRGNNDEELGKEVLYNAIYAGHPYGHHNFGIVSNVAKLTTADLQAFYRAQYTQANLILGIAGGAPEGFVDHVKKDFAALPKGNASPGKRPTPAPIKGLPLTLIDKDTRSVAISFGFPINVKRGDPDWVALLVANSVLGPHRSSGGRLFQRIREVRGLNYGDYSYIEYFPNGMFVFEPAANLARPRQIFQIWVRPLEPPTAHFALRLAFFELERFVRDGITQEEFDNTRDFVGKYINILTKTKSAELGYAIDSAYYGTQDFNSYVNKGLATLTRDQVNAAIRKHLRAENLQVAIVTPKAEDFKKKLLANEPSPMKYNAPKPDDLLAEDKIVEKKALPWKREQIRIVPVDRVFE
ncbi:MAG: pitrilysin family protein [Bryobacteraceae bacterium]